MTITFNQVKEIYKKVAKANGFYIRPWLTLNSSLDVNASMTIFNIKIYQGSLDLYNEDELACVLGHELSHLQFKHLFGLVRNHEKEFDADKVGAKYAANAGYNVIIGRERFKKDAYAASDTHPSSEDRYSVLVKQGW